MGPLAAVAAVGAALAAGHFGNALDLPCAPPTAVNIHLGATRRIPTAHLHEAWWMLYERVAARCPTLGASLTALIKWPGVPP